MKKNHIYLILFLVMAAWGLNIVAMKVLVTHFMPVTMSAFRILTAGLALLLLLSIMRKLRLPTKQEWIYVVFGSLFNVVLYFVFLSIGLTKTTASNGGLILGMVPLLTTILAMLFLGDKATILRVIGIILGIVGVSFIVLKGNSSIRNVSIGDLLVFVSILFQAASYILIKKVSKMIDPRLLTAYMFIIGSPLLFIVSLFLEPNGLASMRNGSASIWLVFFASAIIATALGNMLYNYAIGQIGAAETSIFVNLNPFFTLIGSAIFLGETIGIVQVMGFILILFGVLFASGALEEMYRRLKHRTKHIRNKSYYQ